MNVQMDIFSLIFVRRIPRYTVDIECSDEMKDGETFSPLT